MDRIAGIVPCAGRSTRMGSPKPLLDAGGPTFLERVVRALGRGGCRPLIVVVREPEGPIAATARAAGAEVVVNEDPSEGPISSLRAAVRVLPGDVAGCAFLPVDHPLVEGETVRMLVDALRIGDKPPWAVVPSFRGDRGHPVLFGRSVFDELLHAELEEGARTLLHRHLDRTREIPVEDEGVVTDIDTLPEYRRHFPDAYRKRFHGR